MHLPSSPSGAAAALQEFTSAETTPPLPSWSPVDLPVRTSPRNISHWRLSQPTGFQYQLHRPHIPRHTVNANRLTIGKNRCWRSALRHGPVRYINGAHLQHLEILDLGARLQQRRRSGDGFNSYCRWPLSETQLGVSDSVKADPIASCSRGLTSEK